MNGSPLRVYVGTAIEQLLPFHVLAYTIRRCASAPVDVLPLNEAIAAKGVRIPAPTSSRTRQYTPFSLQRFAIPQLNGYKSVAIYLDSDMIIFRDIHELPRLASPEADVSAAKEPPNSGRKSQISVMVLNCERLNWDVARVVRELEAGVYSYRQLFADLPIAPHFSQSLPHSWNDLERYTPGVTCLTHFTDMETQPWLWARHTLGEIWCKALFDTLEAGAITKEFVLDQVLRGWVRPSLAFQIEHCVVDPLKLPKRVIRDDTLTFTPPHRVGILPLKWMHATASKLTDYGEVNPSAGAKVMRSLQAMCYQGYRRLRGDRLLAH